MPAAAYATTSDLGVYMKGLSITQNSTLLTTLLLDASRRVDRYCERYFYLDAPSTKYFDGDGSPELYVRENDFFNLTALKIALNENNDPADPTAWYLIGGDGRTPPSNYYLEPSNPVEIGSVSDQTALEPYYRVWLPATPRAGTTTDWLNTFTAGSRTVSITANWGWPVIPDDIRDVVIKIAIRMFRARDTGWTGQSGNPIAGITDVTPSHHLDGNDVAILNRYRRSVYV